ncbi:Resolvase, N terminal domain [Roseomonas rosea]|uniref:Resolvase, N terminal domain n=1 Tax=Muricoccus roseus TaxID=198092 RepID=A0A1M6RW10_9PROT|nr:recombinase family protein [Roseomonas rosea]SHK36487.1 Resolvase, N terminal domain [Roseomonas rosea]
MNLGYVRISTEKQALALQRDALTASECAEVFEHPRVWGVATSRPGLGALARIGDCDVLVVWKLDRLGRLLQHLIETVRQLGARGNGFTSLSESSGTTTDGGKPSFHRMCALAEFERALIVERVSAGIAPAKKRGKHVGRPRKLTPDQVAHPCEVIDGGLQTPAGMTGLLEVDHSSLRRLEANASGR